VNLSIRKGFHARSAISSIYEQVEGYDYAISPGRWAAAITLATGRALNVDDRKSPERPSLA
jgi:hypothetical protein